MPDTITAIATPPGEGGISIIRISGNDALAIAQKLFHPKDANAGKNLEPRRVYSGEIHDSKSDQVIDQVLVTYFRKPKSYTGEDVIEISGHGGQLVTERVLQVVMSEGARPAEAGEFTRRAFLNGKLDLAQAEAVADLIHAASDRAHQSALVQLQGGLSDTIDGLYQSLLAVLSQLETAIDFPEEGLAFKQKQKLNEEIATIRTDIEKLVNTFHHGKIYRDGIKVALVGKPNVGKSSLLNALLQKDRAIVTHHPGTTRDSLEERVRLKDIHLSFIDTAGLRHQPEEIEQLGIDRTRQALSECDLALVLFDGSQALDDNDQLIMNEVQSCTRLIVITKNDLPAQWQAESLLTRLGEKKSLSLSVTEGTGIEELKSAVYHHAMGNVPPKESIVITRERHRSALSNADDALCRAMNSLADDRSEDLIALDIQLAQNFLGEILGRTFEDDLLLRIFDDFCIGK